jgi:hypothetical protein
MSVEVADSKMNKFFANDKEFVTISKEGTCLPSAGRPRRRGWQGELFGVTPPGNADGYQNKGLARKAIRKVMKIKGIKIDVDGHEEGFARL